MNQFFAILLAILIPAISAAQQQSDTRTAKQKRYSVRKKIKLGKKLTEKGSYFNALMYFQEAYEKKPSKLVALERAAHLNYLMRDYKKAEEQYKLLLDNEKGLFKYPDTRYWYALMLKYNGKYDEAKAEFEKFKSEYGDKEDNAATLKKRAVKHIEGCNLAKELLAKPDRVRIEHLNEKINNPYTDYAPKMLRSTDNIIFSSIKSDTVINLTLSGDANYKSKIYTANFGNGNWSVQPLPENINNAAYHNGNGVFSQDYKRFYFTRCNEGKKLQMECAIYASQHDNGRFSEPVKLGETINPEGTNNTQPALATDAQGREILYFVSDRKGGQGGKDIWYAIGNGDNTFGEAVNLGKVINTSEDEVTPFYDSNQGLLFFSSDGHANVGGFDIFKAEGKEKEWKNPINLGFPINSSVDDIYYTVWTDKKTGYFVSNRPGGYNLKSETCCDDIYKATIIREVYLKGFVATKKEPTKPIKGANVSFFLKDLSTGTLSPIANITTGQDEYFIVPVNPEKTYQVNTTKAGYWGSEEIFVAGQEKMVKDTIYKTFFIDEIAKRKLVLKRIYYEFDKYFIRREDVVTLDSLAKVLKENPAWTMEIYGHTDSKGSEDYNMRLGKARAQAAADYLVTKYKIDINRLSLISKGESEPRMPNQNPDGSDNPLGRANNRRVEFKVNSNDKFLEVEIEYTNNERKDTR
jgi:outer membrane protein OmpA-like peptidoglycan-associated protein/tetratricopeptide (TPR) repeat protein